MGVKELLKDEIKSITPEQLKSFAEDFKKRKLESFSGGYAEYSFPWKGTIYQIQMAVDKDGNFKLMGL